MLLLKTDKIGFAGTTGLRVIGKLRLFIVETLTWKLWTKHTYMTVQLFSKTCVKSLMDSGSRRSAVLSGGPSGQQGLLCWLKHTHKSKLFFKWANKILLCLLSSCQFIHLITVLPILYTMIE